jgi:hypothetical protein
MAAPTTARRRRKAEATTAELLRAVAGERIAIGDGEPHRRRSLREALAHLLWDMALRGDLAACRLILEYMEGKPVQRVAAEVRASGQPEANADEMANATAGLEAWLDSLAPGDGEGSVPRLPAAFDDG